MPKPEYLFSDQYRSALGENEVAFYGDDTGFGVVRSIGLEDGLTAQVVFQDWDGEPDVLVMRTDKIFGEDPTANRDAVSMLIDMARADVDPSLKV